MEITLFDTKVKVNDGSCGLNGGSGKSSTPYVNLYVRLTNSCQAACNFCEFHPSITYVQDFDVYKFLYTVHKIKSKVQINKISFTGGEPTILINKLNLLLKEIKEIDPKIYTVVNTNGYNLLGIDVENVNSISLSRHSLLDEINYQIFKTKNIPSYEEIKKYPHKDKLHLSCNLIQNSVDSTKNCENYIDFFANAGIQEIGFVSLMPVNEFCKNKFIDFNTINFLGMKNTIQTQSWCKKTNDKDKCRTVCRCSNFLKYTDKGNFVSFYSRYYIDKEETSGMLVYDVNGDLKVGFNGEVINKG